MTEVCSCSWRRFCEIPLMTARDPDCVVHGDATERWAYIRARTRQIAEDRLADEKTQP